MDATADGHGRWSCSAPLIRELRWVLVIAALAGGVGKAHASPASSPRSGWTFKFKDFVIGAWLGPDRTEAEVRLYKEAGFNVVMVGRYMARGQYALPDEVAQELDLVHKFGLGAMLDTYTQNDKPWGGLAPPSVKGGHHACSSAELKWIHRRFGKHPALIGYMIGDDQGKMSRRLQECTLFLLNHAPQLMPWVCGVVPAKDLAAHHNPFVDWQIYPTLYRRNDTAEQQARQYCIAYDRLRRDCQRYDCISWPMFNACGPGVTDSLLRFPLYAALAYGAQGIWYFTYRTALTNGREGQTGHTTYAAALADVKPNWYVARAANHRVAAYGPCLLGARSTGVFSTGWPVPGAHTPEPGRLVGRMSSNLLVGVLSKPGHGPLVMVVDKRVSKRRNAVPPRLTDLTFSPKVKGVRVLDTSRSTRLAGNHIRLSLAGGEGRLLELEE